MLSSVNFSPSRSEFLFRVRYKKKKISAKRKKNGSIFAGNFIFPRIYIGTINTRGVREKNIESTRLKKLDTELKVEEKKSTFSKNSN